MKKKLIIGSLILTAAVGYLFYWSFQGSAATYYTVTQFFDKANTLAEKTVRITGNVTPGSVEQKAGDINLKFIIHDGSKSLTVVYRGLVPDAFTEGNSVVVEGKLDANGVFQASSLMVKCPSKYSPTTPTAELPTAIGLSSWLT